MKKQNQKQLYLAAILREFNGDFKTESLNANGWSNHPWRSEEDAFKAYVEKQLGLKFVPIKADSLNCDMFLIAKYDYDNEGFMSVDMDELNKEKIKIETYVCKKILGLK